MTADSKAPGADAVYLNVEENDNLQPGVSTVHVRIKVLTEKGRDLATVDIPYRKDCEQLALIRGRTIHADGSVILLTAKPEDLLIEKTQDTQYLRKVFTLPSVEVGSILEYHYDIQYLPCQYYLTPSWDVQREYFIHKAHYAYAPPDNANNVVDAHGNIVSNMLAWHELPAGAELKLNPAGHFVLDATDIPPLPREEWMPPLKNIEYQVRFFMKYADDQRDFWAREAKNWSGNIADFIKPTGTLRDAVFSLTSSGDNTIEKARKLYAAVQALENTDFSRAKSESERKQLRIRNARRAEDVWTQRSGSGDDLALLYLALLRTAGLTAYPMRVVNRDHADFNSGDLEMDQFDDTLVILSAEGKEIFLDPGQKMCPFGMLHWKHAGAVGIRESANGPEVGPAPLQSYAENATQYIGDLTVDAYGAVSGNLRVVMTGQEALHWRQTALENDETAIKKQLDAGLETMVPNGVAARVDHLLGLSDPNSLLVAIVNIQGSFSTQSGKRLLLPAFFFETRGYEPFVDEKTRQTPVDMRYGSVLTEQVTYRLPATMNLEGLPSDARTLWKDHALYSAIVRRAPGEIDITRRLARAFAIAKPDEYQDLREFYQKVAADDQEQIVLAGVAAGVNAK